MFCCVLQPLVYDCWECVVAVCQTLRIASFTVTQLPGPNYHCREGESTAVREMPKEWWGHIAVDVKRQVTPSFSPPSLNLIPHC